MDKRGYAGQKALLRREDERKAQDHMRALREGRPNHHSAFTPENKDIHLLTPEMKTELALAFWWTLSTLILIVMLAVFISAFVK